MNAVTLPPAPAPLEHLAVATGPHSQQFGPGLILLVLLVLGGLSYGAVRLNTRRLSAQRPGTRRRAAGPKQQPPALSPQPLPARHPGAGTVVQVDCAEPDRAAKLIGEAGIALGAALTQAGLTVTLPAGASRELVADLNRRLVGAGIGRSRMRHACSRPGSWRRSC